MIIIADQVTKYLIKANFSLYEKLVVIKGLFQITYVRNSGAVWGILSDHPSQLVSVVITVFSITALVVVMVFFARLEANCKFELTSLSFIIGGALGNIIDRVNQGYVVDFLDVFIKNSHWPTFNVADSFISIGVVVLIISIWRGKCTQF